MTPDEMSKGMLVMLGSGGPPMTVRVVSGDTAYCEWFAGLERRQGTFEIATLVPVPTTPDPLE